jgi:hypothetical protein
MMENIQPHRAIINQLAQLIQAHVQNTVNSLIQNARSYKIKEFKRKNIQDRNNRNRNIANVKPFSLNTQRRIQEKENRAPIIGKLSILIGHNKVLLFLCVFLVF